MKRNEIIAKIKELKAEEDSFDMGLEYSEISSIRGRIEDLKDELKSYELKKPIKEMLDHIRNGKHAEAGKALSEYITQKSKSILNEEIDNEKLEKYILKTIPVKALYIADKTGDYDNIINGLQARRLINLRTVDVPQLIRIIRNLTKKRIDIENNTQPSSGIDDDKLFMYIDKMNKREVIELWSTVQLHNVLQDLESKKIIPSAMKASEHGNTTVQSLKDLINTHIYKKYNF